MHNHSFTKKHLVWLLPLILLIIGGVYILHSYLTLPNYTLQSTDFKESTDIINNPYMGWYRIYAYTIDDTTDFDADSVTEAVSYDPDSRLALIELNIKAYRDGAISDQGLSKISDILDAWSHTNKQIILRIMYDWDGNAEHTEPSDISIVKEHMAQLGALINTHADSIYLLQGIFVGDYAEMHSSQHMSDDGMTDLMNTLASVTDPSIFLGVRTPAHWRIINQCYEPLSIDKAYSGSLDSRISLFNDGMLASGNDLGTYGDTPATEATAYGYKGIRADELTFQNQLCQYVPNGGEVVLDNSYNDLEHAISDLKAMHVSYLNYDYDAAVLDKWKSSTYVGDDIYRNMNGYDYISCHMGYRFVLQDITLTTPQETGLSAFFAHLLQPKASSTLQISVANTGFTNYYMPCSLAVILTNTNTKQTYSCNISEDIRSINSGDITTLTAALDSSIPEGTYQMALQCSDSTTGEVLTMANVTGNPLGTLTITKRIH